MRRARTYESILKRALTNGGSAHETQEIRTLAILYRRRLSKNPRNHWFSTSESIERRKEFGTRLPALIHGLKKIGFRIQRGKVLGSRIAYYRLKEIPTAKR